MENRNSEKFIDDLLKGMPAVEIPEDLSFDAGSIMESARAVKTPEIVDFAPLKAKTRGRFIRRLGAAAALFAIAAGTVYYGLDRGMASGDKSNFETAEMPGCYMALDSSEYSPESRDKSQFSPEPDINSSPVDFVDRFYEACRDEHFSSEISALDLGYGFKIIDVVDAEDGTRFMIYFYESEEDTGVPVPDKIRSIVWKKR